MSRLRNTAGHLKNVRIFFNTTFLLFSSFLTIMHNSDTFLWERYGSNVPCSNPEIFQSETSDIVTVCSPPFPGQRKHFFISCLTWSESNGKVWQFTVTVLQLIMIPGTVWSRCDFCGKMYTASGSLRLHLKSHLSRLGKFSHLLHSVTFL